MSNIFARLALPIIVLLAAASAAGAADNMRLRGGLDDARIQFAQAKKGHVAFLGGSITEMDGYRPMVMEILRRRFPETDFTFTNAGVASTCSTTGAARLASDVLSQGPVDLCFVEFAVNDDQDAHHTRAECVRGLEGIIRHLRKHNPKAGIVVTFFVNPEMLAQIQRGETPLTIAAHRQVAKHYGVSTINLAQEIAEQIAAGKITWKQYGGTHPAPRGNRVCADMIDQLFTQAWREPQTIDHKPHFQGADASRRQPPSTSHKPQTTQSLPQPLDPLNYEHGRFLDLKEAKIKRGWTLCVPDWKSLAGGKRERFTHIPMLAATEPGAELALDFTGTMVGAYIVAGPDAGVVEASIDGGPFEPVNLYHHYSRNLHYPRTVLLGSELKPGKHRLALRVSHDTKSGGHAARIMKFVAN